MSAPPGGPGSGGGSGSGGPWLSSREALRATARETLRFLRSVLAQLGTAEDARDSIVYRLETLPRLDPGFCPSFTTPARIQVVNQDTFNTALELSAAAADQGAETSRERGDNPLPAVINFACHDKPGGGWLNGALAQEEALCYRSSLWLSLRSVYGPSKPLKPGEAVYSPYVVVVRGDLAGGHRLLSREGPFPIVSVLSVPALRGPHTQTVRRPAGWHGAAAADERVFLHDADRDLTKQKMRLVLRAAAHHRHRRLVLGALGCGVYANPPEDVAHCWLEVLREHEFAGGWWLQVCFAVFDPNNEGNYEIFRRVLHDQTL